MQVQERSALAIGWLAAAGQFFLAHYSIVLSVACGLGALGASLYSIAVSRAKLRFYIDQAEDFEANHPRPHK